jgi:hypothetical protein
VAAAPTISKPAEPEVTSRPNAFDSLLQKLQDAPPPGLLDSTDPTMADVKMDAITASVEDTLRDDNAAAGSSGEKEAASDPLAAAKNLFAIAASAVK